MALDPQLLMSLANMFTGPGGNSQQPNGGFDGANAKMFSDLAEKIPVAGPIAGGLARGFSKGMGTAANIVSAPVNGPIDALVGALGGAQKASRPDTGGMGAPAMGPAGLPPLPPASSRPSAQTGTWDKAAQMVPEDGPTNPMHTRPMGPLGEQEQTPNRQTGTNPMRSQPMGPFSDNPSASSALSNQYQQQDPTADPLRKRRPMGPF